MRYDLTRWNRAGLKKFRYVDGNAATFLEDLRKELLAHFPAWSALDTDIPASETTAQRNARLEAQYGALRREWGWEIGRSFARAAHVLTEHLDACANEGYLGTATQWENVRRLVEMIGYHPAPPASASTPLVLLAKQDQSGTLAKGFQVSHTPKAGAPVLFETLDDLEVAASLNELHPHQWEWSPAPLSGALWQLGKKQEVSAGALALLHNPATGACHGVKIGAVSASGQLTLEAVNAGDDWSAWHSGDAWLWFNPAAIFKPSLNGSNVIRLPEGHGLAVGDIVAWQPSGGGAWQYNTVLAIDAQSAQINGTQPSAGTSLYRAFTIRSEGGVLRFPSGARAVSSQKSGAANNLAGFTITTETGSGPDYNSSYKKISTSPPGEIYLVPLQGEVQTSVAAALPAGDFVFAGSPGDLTGGDRAIGETGAGQYSVLVVKEVIKREADFTLSFVNAPVTLERLYGPMQDSLRPQDYNVNATALASPLLLEMPASGTWAALLKVGRRMVLEQVDSSGASLKGWSAKLMSVDAASGAITLDSMPPAADGYTLGNTVVRANVVMAGHGESKPAKILGSGDATRSFQEFTLAEKEVSFIADSAMASGVAAAIEVKVGDQVWQQASTLDDSEPTDAHYTARLSEEGHVRITFGDGQHGRRLPTGSSNVRVGYRIGAGLAGILAAGSLEKPVKPHVLIDKVRQPVATSGGNDREPVASLRSNAPAALFTLERAVSVEDYGRLAERNSSVWQARALRLPNQGAQQERIRVVVVPAGGGALGELATTLRDFLEAHDLPGTRVEVVNHVAVPFDLDITVQVDSSQYVPEEVRSDVQAALLEAFALRQRRLGQPLYPSEVIAVVEAVEGVLNSRCLIGGAAFAVITPQPRVLKSAGGQIRLIQPAPEQVLILDVALSSVTVQTREFVL
ncbi:MAG: putative baseplate assembly protein [Sulfurimicrobium sp.]|nr:putative baseplate assembly protein [Sulfurimicrobium sp.]